MSETAGLIFLRRVEKRAQKLQGSIELGTGDLNLIIRDYAKLEAQVVSLREALSAEDAWLLAEDLDELIYEHGNDKAMGCGGAYTKITNYARILDALDA